MRWFSPLLNSMSPLRTFCTNFRPLLGAQHTLVLPYLENLCTHDETVVRERAVIAISKLLSNYTDNEVNNFIVPLVFLI